MSFPRTELTATSCPPLPEGQLTWQLLLPNNKTVGSTATWHKGSAGLKGMAGLKGASGLKGMAGLKGASALRGQRGLSPQGSKGPQPSGLKGASDTYNNFTGLRFFLQNTSYNIILVTI